jgi:hypothetical protein
MQLNNLNLQDLFQDFKPYGVGVHYNEYGQHMGTADLFVDTRSAQNILQEFAKIAIDGSFIPHYFDESYLYAF